MWMFWIIAGVYIQALITQTESAFISHNLVSGPPTDYVIFGADLPVRYSLLNPQPGNYLGLYKQGSNNEIARITVQQVKQGIVQFPCDTITSPGEYVVRLFKSDGTELALGEVCQFSAVWPKFQLTLPSTHIAQEEVKPQLTSSYINQRVTCKTQSTPVSFSLEVQYSEDDSFTEYYVVHLEQDISLRKQNSDTHTFPCELFDRAGFYRVLLKESNSDDVLSTSSIMSATWGDYYKLSSKQNRVFPCTDELVIDYTRPKCVTMEDNIHMFATRVDKSGQQELEYMYEAKATVDKSSVTFLCDDIRKYQWNNNPTAYCFRYQTVASNQAVVDHSLFCLPINSTIGLPVDGRWSTWSNWSECSGNCEIGRQSRFRYCNSPSPANGGKFCDGGVSVDWQGCESSCKTAPVPRTSVVTSRPSYKVPKCWCGCNMSESSGIIIPGRDCRGSADYLVHMVWYISTQPDSLIQLNVTEFKWSLDSQMLRVRDGITYSSQLILDLKGNQDQQNQHIVSSSNQLHVEFMSNEAVPYDVDLFLAIYNTYNPVAKPLSPTGVATGQSQEQPKWKMSAIIGGAVTGTVLVITIFSAYIYRRVRIAQVIKRTQAQNSSPNHVVMQVQSGEYTNFGDITPSVQTVTGLRHPRQAHNSLNGSEPDRHHSHRHKHHQRHRHKLQGIKEDETANIPLPDPYHVKPEDFLHASDLLHLSSGAVDSEHALNRNITIVKSPTKHKPKRKQKRRRLKAKPNLYEDPQEVDKLINSLPVGTPSKRYASAPPADPDSEYRALINQLSSTGSHNQSSLIDTSAEVHPVPHTTPVEDTSQELSPLVSPDVINGQRSPCLDDGYNSLANTGSTQSNLSCRDRDVHVVPRLNLIKERPGNKSENSSEFSPSPDNRTLQRHSTHTCGITSPHITDKVDDLQLSHVTCPLQRPDGESDESLAVPSDSFCSNQSSPMQQAALAPPDYFADSSKSPINCITRPKEGPALLYVKKSSDAMMSNSNTTSDSYDYDDYLPPPAANGHESIHSDISWPQPPIAEETFIS